jgi:hypothetical protein
VQGAEHEEERCDCGGDHSEPQPWAELAVPLRQYVDAVLVEEAAHLAREGRADIIDSSDGIDGLSAKIVEYADTMSPGELASVGKALEVFRMPRAATLIRLTEALTQARHLLCGETSRWAELPANDRAFVRNVVARTHANILASLAHAAVSREVTNAALATLESVSSSVFGGILGGQALGGGMVAGAAARADAIAAAGELLGVAGYE